MDNLERIDYKKNQSKELSRFYRGTFEISDCADTFLKLDNFRKGIVFLNGFHLGRYWDIGPQKMLYVPKFILKEGKNEIVLFESDGIKGTAEVELCDCAILG